MSDLSDFIMEFRNKPDAPPAVAPQPPRERKPPRVLAIANQKGGVGKTTTAINLGTALAAVGERVLIVDFDPQGNASTGLGIDRKSRRLSTYDVMIGEATLRDAVMATAVPSLSIAPSTLDLSGLELQVSQERDRAVRLRNALAPLNTGETDGVDFSYVLIDCPPSLNLLTINAMAAADAVLVPLQCEFFALEGLSQLLETVEQVRTGLHPDLIIHGIVLTMHDARNNLSNQVVADVRQYSGQKVYDTVIPRNVRVSEAPSFGKPVLVYDLKCVGSEAYLRLATEIIQREKELTGGATPAAVPTPEPEQAPPIDPAASVQVSAHPTETPAHSLENRSPGEAQRDPGARDEAQRNPGPPTPHSAPRHADDAETPPDPNEPIADTKPTPPESDSNPGEDAA